jgi:predicted ATPase
VAYGTVLQERRKTLHEQTARAIEALYHDRLDERYSDLAHHYTRSSNTEKAIEYLHLTGQQAVQRSANVEAITHLISALELLKTLPDTPERIQQEIILQVTLGPALMVIKGLADSEVGNAYARARVLCQQLGETPHLFPVLWGLCVFYLIRAEFKTARELGEHCLSLAQSRQDPALLVKAHQILGAILTCLGEFASAREHSEQSLALYDSQQHHALAFLYGGIDPGVACLVDVALELWPLGYPDQALKRVHEALRLAQELSHPLSLSFALSVAAQLCQLRREIYLAQEQAEAAMALSIKQGFPSWLVLASIFRGWALTEQGHNEEGMAQLCQGLATLRTTGVEFSRPSCLALLAEAYGKGGQIEEGLSIVAEALAAVDKEAGERFYEAELYRLKGELSLQSQTSLKQVQDKSQTSQDKSEIPSPQTEMGQEAEKCFLKAIEIARSQLAKSWELRATTSLARLWQQQGRKAEARQLLAEIYGWFTEGFDTKDLQEAKALLEELA